MSILAKVQYERDEFCRFDDYGRYAKHLSRKLHTLKKSGQKSDDVLLFSAERVWSNAMQNKSVNGKIQFTLNKLRKACKHANTLVDATASESATNKLQAIIYRDILQAALCQERGAYPEAITYFSRALVALQNQSSSLMESVETGLRFSIYQSGAEERSINLQKFALEQLADESEHDDWRSLVQEVNPTALQEEKGEEMITSIQWANRSAHLTNPDLASAISTATSARAALSGDCTPNEFDTILAAWTSASTTLTALLDAEEDQDRAQDLELIKAWLSYHSAQDRIARDLALVPTVSTREGILLYDAIYRTYAQILATPGLDAQQTQDNTLKRRESRGERCLLLAKTHGNSLEAIALVSRALTYFDATSPRRQDVVRLLNQTNARYTLSAKKQSPFVPSKWFAGDVKALGNFDPRSLCSKSVTLKPVVFDIAWNYIVAQQNGQAGHTQAQATSLAGAAQKVVKEVQEAVGTSPASAPKKGLFGGLFGGSGR